MSFNPIDRLREGNADFLLEDWLTDYDIKNLVERIRNTEDKADIIRLIMPKIKKRMPHFLFDIMYDIDAFERSTKGFLNSTRKSWFKIDVTKIQNLLYNTTWGEKYIFNNFEELLVENEMSKMEIITRYAFFSSSMKNKWVEMFTKTKNMSVRAMFIKNLLVSCPNEAHAFLKNPEIILVDNPEIGEQISFLPHMVSDKDLSEIIVLAIDSNINTEVLNNLKDFLLKNYKKNELAGLLVSPTNRMYKDIYEQVFAEHSNELFLTSKKHKWYILNRYKELLSEEIVNQYNRIFRVDEVYKTSQKSFFSPVSDLYVHGLGDTLKIVIDKYLSLSSTEEVRYLSSGSMSYAFQIGNYVLKFGRGKWSYEEQICPNLYIILKNLEEYYVRDKKGLVIANLEVQKLLTKKAEMIDEKHFNLFHTELKRLGYYTDDPRTNSKSGENFGILDSYKEADFCDVEALPESFKEVPLVMYDRDRVFKIGSNPKVIRESIRY